MRCKIYAHIVPTSYASLIPMSNPGPCVPYVRVHAWGEHTSYACVSSEAKRTHHVCAIRGHAHVHLPYTSSAGGSAAPMTSVHSQPVHPTGRGNVQKRRKPIQACTFIQPGPSAHPTVGLRD